MGQLGRQILLGLAFTAVLFGLLFTILGLKASAQSFDLLGFILVGPGLVAAGIAYIGYAELRSNREAMAVQALKPMNVVFFDDPPPPAA